MKVAHFARFDPCRSGQYATVKDLITAERKLGIDAGFIDSDACGACNHWFSNSGREDGSLKTYPSDWAKDADILIRHTALPQEFMELGIPIILCLHGRPESSFLLEEQRTAPIISFLTEVANDERYKAFVTFWEEHTIHWSSLLPKDKIHYVPAMVDTDLFSPAGAKLNYGNDGGSPNIMIADLWRTDTTPFNVLYAAMRFRQLQDTPKARLQVFGLPEAKPGAIAVVARVLKDSGLWGKAFTTYTKMAGAYRAADILITPHHIATRVIREALACGLPIVANEGCKYTPYTANPKDVDGFAEKIQQCWIDIKSNSEAKQHCRTTALRVFNLDQAGKAMLKVFEQVLEAKPTSWVPVKKSFTKRPYRGYSQYMDHQVSKLNKRLNFIKNFDALYEQDLGKRLAEWDFIKSGSSVLCLGARLGGEVKAFLSAGCFAVGIDLNPGQDNRCVLTGDFHNLQYKDNSVDVVFTNSIDHVFDIDKFVQEIKRVLKPDGTLIIELVNSKEASKDKWASLQWENSDPILSLFAEQGFELIKRTSFQSVWFNEQLCLRNAKTVSTGVISISSLGNYGRFGNQIFQYAALSIYAKQYGLTAQVPVDWIGREIFNVEAGPITTKLPTRNFGKDKTSIFGEHAKAELENKDIAGYFQYPTTWYNQHHEFFCDLFKPQSSVEKTAEEILADIKGDAKTLIGIHIRKGDYGKGKFQIAPVQWYLDWLKNNWDELERPKLFIASDEISANLLESFEKYRPVHCNMPGNKHLFFYDHYILAHCNYLLISNSSFSFTAAMLNQQAKSDPGYLRPFWRPDFSSRKLVIFDPWNSKPFLDHKIDPATRLHLGCGNVYVPGYTNIDIDSEKADVKKDIRELDYESNSIDDIVLMHVLEHFSRVDALGLIIKWHDWLQVGGRLIIEVPDFKKSAEGLLHASSETQAKILRHLTGDQGSEWSFHKTQWSKESLESTLKIFGFRIERSTTKPMKHNGLFSASVEVIKEKAVLLEDQYQVAVDILAQSQTSNSDGEKAKHTKWCEQLRGILGIAKIAAVASQTKVKTDGKVKLALVYARQDHKLQTDSYSQTYKQMFDALIFKFLDIQHINQNCSAQGIEADVVLFYDVHSCHHIKIDGIEKHPAVKYTYFNDPHQVEVKGHYPDKTYVHKLGPEQRVERALRRGVRFIICPYTDSYYQFIAPHLAGREADDMLVWFPVAPRQPNGIVSKLHSRAKNVLACGYDKRIKDCSIYDFRSWAFQQPYVARILHVLEDPETPKGDEFIKFLTQWAGALALTNFAVVPKYLEIPLAGCVCFAQEREDYKRMGFKDGESCIFVNENNFEKKIKEFTNATPVNGYQQIADAGRRIIEENYTAKHFANFMHEHIKQQL